MQKEFDKLFKEILDLTNVSEKTKNIDGWLEEMEGCALYAIAKFGPAKGAIVEIGSFKGKSTVWIAQGSKSRNREKVYSIDPHTGSVENKPGHKFASHMPPEGTTKFVFLRNLKKYGVYDWVVPIIKKSEDAVKNWNKPIRFLFIDGDHRYKYVRNDFLEWSRYLVKGAIIAFHDYYVWSGPTKVVNKYLRSSSEFSTLGFIKSLALYQYLKK
jgi:predicted O-methyltransferase YrrM